MSAPKLLTFQEACAYLQLSDKTLRQLIARGDIRAGKVGGTWRIQQAEIVAYFDRQCAVNEATLPSAVRGKTRRRSAPASGERPWAPLVSRGQSGTAGRGTVLDSILAEPWRKPKTGG